MFFSTILFEKSFPSVRSFWYLFSQPAGKDFSVLKCYFPLYMSV
nr:MAG TPA: hypothetical protein [Caudoviricetes sp.]